MAAPKPNSNSPPGARQGTHRSQYRRHNIGRHQLKRRGVATGSHGVRTDKAMRQGMLSDVAESRPIGAA